MPNFGDLTLLILIGIFGGLANLWLGQSYKLAEVSLVYSFEIFSSSVCNCFWIFYRDEIPSLKTLFGAALVIISSIIIFRREIYLKKQFSIPRNE